MALQYWRLTMWGLALGLVFGVWNLVSTQLAPLAEDSPIALAVFYGPMFTIWGVAGFLAFRRTRRLRKAVEAGTIVALITFIVFTLTILVRINLFLEPISQRSDWSNLVADYRVSGFASLRLYANYVYAKGTPLKLLVASTIGAVSGLVGGLLGTILRPNRHSLTFEDRTAKLDN